MATQIEVVYPSTSAFSGSSQLNLGPYPTLFTEVLLRAEVRGQINVQGITLAANGVHANFLLWALQWVPHTASPADCVTTADGPNWLIREQMGTQDLTSNWAPASGSGVDIVSYGLRAEWAGQLVIGGPIDLWLSLKPPTGVSVFNYNLFASIRFWWS